MTRMRNMIAAFLALLLLSGCVGPESAPEKDTVEEDAPPYMDEPITVSGDERISVVAVRASQVGAGWQFPLEDYVGEFLGVGLHSSSFILLDSSRIAWLEDGEAIWLMPMAREGKGILFNAVYSRSVDDCGSGEALVLGKSYQPSDLRDGSSFERDGRWKVALEAENGCLKRIVIYMDGYFSDLSDGEQISLFRNDNTVLFGFESLAEGPVARVIGTRPS